MVVKVFPNSEAVKKLKTPLTEGEKEFGNKMYGILQQIENRFFKLHAQPNINGERPDIFIIAPIVKLK